MNKQEIYNYIRNVDPNTRFERMVNLLAKAFEEIDELKSRVSELEGDEDEEKDSHSRRTLKEMFNQL